MSTGQYFPHQYNAHDDEKLQRVVIDHGLVGYAVFFLLLEYLGQKKDRALTKDFYKVLAWNYRIDEEVVRSVVEDYDLFEVSDNQFRSCGLNARMAILDEKIAKRRAAGAMGGQKRVANLKQNSSNAQAMLEENQANSKQCLSNVEANSSNKRREDKEENKEKSTQQDKSCVCAKKENKLPLVSTHTHTQNFNFDERVCDADFLNIVSRYMRKYACAPVEEAHKLIEMMHPSWQGKYENFTDHKSDACQFIIISRDRKYMAASRASVDECRMIDTFIELIAAAEIYDLSVLNAYRGMTVLDGNKVVINFSRRDIPDALEVDYFGSWSIAVRNKFGNDVQLEYRISNG